MNICLFKGDDHSEVGGQGEGFVGGRVGSEHPEQVTLVQLGRVFTPIHGKIRFLDALASLYFKLSVTEWVTFLQLAHLRVFQII